MLAEAGAITSRSARLARWMCSTLAVSMGSKVSVWQRFPLRLSKGMGETIFLAFSVRIVSTFTPCFTRREQRLGIL